MLGLFKSQLQNPKSKRNAWQCLHNHYIEKLHKENMQSLITGRKIEDDSRKDAVLEIMADRYCRSILENTMEKPKSAMEISSETKIPISTVYRRLQTLHDNKLLGISGSISQDGKKYFLYKSRVKAISTSFNNGSVEVEIVPNTS